MPRDIFLFDKSIRMGNQRHPRNGHNFVYITEQNGMFNKPYKIIAITTVVICSCINNRGEETWVLMNRMSYT